MKLFIILQVISGSSRLAQLAWVTAQQRDNLNRLIVAHPDCTPAICCQRANTLDNTVFVDGYKVLGFQVILLYDLFYVLLHIFCHPHFFIQPRIVLLFI